MRNVEASRCKIVGPLAGGVVVEVEYKCPYCKFINVTNTMSYNSVGMDTSQEYEFNDECACCFKEVNVIYKDSMIKDLENIRIVANYWKAYLRNEMDHDEYTILANCTCPNCNCTTDYWFKVSRKEFESNHVYTFFHKCQCCGTDMRMVLENSDRHR